MPRNVPPGGRRIHLNVPHLLGRGDPAGYGRGEPTFHHEVVGGGGADSGLEGGAVGEAWRCVPGAFTRHGRAGIVPVDECCNGACIDLILGCGLMSGLSVGGGCGGGLLKLRLAV